MKKILNLVIILLITFSCSNDDSTESQQQNEFPTNITISSQTAEIGEIITINGNGFLTNESYSVIFNENKIATIIEIESNYLKVEVPENAVSGSIILTYKNQTKTIGDIIITKNEELYLFKRNYENNNFQVSLVKYELDSSTETIVYSLGNDFDQTEIFSSNLGDVSSVYHSSKNEIITLDYANSKILRVNLTNGSETTNSLPVGQFENYHGLTITKNEELYLFKRNYENNNFQVSLVKYDLDSSTETIVYSLGNDFDQTEIFSSNLGDVSSVYHSSKNEIITLDYANSKILRVNLTNGSETTNSLPVGQFENYHGLTITKNEELIK